MSQPYSGFQRAGVVYPLTTSGTDTLLQDADSSLFFLLDWVSFLINQYCGDRLIQAARGANLPNFNSAVEQRYPSLPTGELQQNQYRFPLLCIGRTETLSGRLTQGWERDRCLFELLYVLPPLGPAQVEQVGPILHAIDVAIRERTTEGFDPAYTPPGGTLGQSPFGATFSSLQDVGFGDPYRDLTRSTVYGFMEGGGNLYFPCVRLSGYFSERDMYNKTAEGAVTFTGADITEDLVAPDGTVIDPFVQVSTQLAPTITSVSPPSGPFAGGTTVTVAGTNFLKGATVYFGSAQYAPSVTWNSSTSLTVTTPAMSGPSTVALPVVVTNPPYEGQSGSMQWAFTFV